MCLMLKGMLIFYVEGAPKYVFDKDGRVLSFYAERPDKCVFDNVEKDVKFLC